MANQLVERNSGDRAEETLFAPGEDASEDSLFGIDLRHYLNLVRRNLLFILLIVGGALALGVLVTMLTVPTYVATARVLVEQEAEQIIEGTDLTPTTNAWDIDRFLQTQVDILQSRTLAERVVEAGDLSKDDDFFAAMNIVLPDAAELEGKYAGPKGYTKYREELAIGLVHGGMIANLPTGSRIIAIGFRGTDPLYAAKLSNAYAENYIEANLNRKFESSAYARQFLSDQLQEARTQLEASERELNQYSRAAGLIRVAGQGQNADQGGTLSVTNDSLIQLNAAASEATAERVAAQNRWQTIAREPILSVPQVLQNPAIQDLIKQKTLVQAELAQEKARHLDGHPTVQALNAQVGELDSRMQAVGNSIKRSVQLEFEAARQKEGALQSRVSQIRSAALSEQDRGVEFSVLKRVADTNRALYDSLLERFNQLSATAGASSNNITLVDAAEVPTRPSSPNLPLNVVLALMSGLFLAGAFVFLRDYFDDAIRSPDDVERKLGLPMLGLIPAVGDPATDAQDSMSSLSESYHALVTNLMYSTASGLPRSILITSAGEGEGKTTTAHAIALDLARLGRSVLLIDADLRRPTLHHRIKDSTRAGLTEVLAGQASLDEVAIASGEPNLTYVTALPIPPEPSILLGSERLPRILREASSRYDVVIVDSPPMLGLSDTATLSSQIEAVILMVDASEFQRGAVKSALRRLKLINANVLGVALSKFDPRAADGEYRYYGYSYYQYGKQSGA